MLRELPSSLDALMTLCIRVDDRVRVHRSMHARVFHEPVECSEGATVARGSREPDLAEPEEEPMQPGRSWLTPAEHHCCCFAAGE